MSVAHRQSAEPGGHHGKRAAETPRMPARPGSGRHSGPHPASAVDPERSIDPVADEAALDDALAMTPRGTLVVAVTAVALMLLGWLLLYFLVFLARGPVA
jgi:hypothetical protein